MYPLGVRLVTARMPKRNGEPVVDEFFGYMSTSKNSRGDGGGGLNLLGEYCEGTPTSTVGENTSITMRGLFPLTYHAGHPYYSGARTSRFASVGLLQGCSWGDHLRKVGVVPLDETKFSEDAVLLVEGVAGTTSAPAAVCISGDVCVRGIVVRRGGVLFVDEDRPTTIRANFIFVESGGLFQAGSDAALEFRYAGELRIVLTHPAGGYDTMPVVASQYPYQVYAPGVDWLLESETPPQGHGRDIFAGFDGTNMCFTNAFCSKTISVGFNGSCVLCGSTTTAVPYAGTWKSHAAQGGSLWTNGKESLSVGADVLLAKAYPFTWARLSPGSGAKGTQSLRLHPDDTAGLGLNDLLRVFPPGREVQVVVTSSTPQLTTPQNVNGLFPIFIAEKTGADLENLRQNNAACAKYTRGGATGFLHPDRWVEVVVVVQAKLSDRNDGSVELLLRDALRLGHDLETVELSNLSGEKVVVEVTHHVGLLTHNIVVEGQDLERKAVSMDGGGGCNLLAPDISGAKAMGLGLANQTGAVMMAPLAAVSGGHLMGDDGAGDGTIMASGGALGPNYKNLTEGGSQEVTRFCYLDQTPAGKAALSGVGQRPTRAGDLQGLWLFGTAGAPGRGCNVVFGGSCMFRYGSSVLFDGVEVVRMGIAPNFGSIGQYALHFHLYGFAKSFTGYLPSARHPREASVRNCSIWRSYSRFATLHGACEVDLSNNVCCISYGSGFFVEDGTELLNVFQHNLACCLFPSCTNGFFNPQPIYANVSTDFCTMSVFWMKNNLNVIARNVGCCCPGNTAMVWYVPQLVNQLRGPSAVCFGSEKYGLPACGSLEAITSSGLGATLPPVTNAGGALVAFKSSCNGGRCACWVPAGFAFPFTDPGTGCSSYTGDNGQTPVFLNAENVAYCIALFQTEFPEGIKGGPQPFEASGLVPSQGCSWALQDGVAQAQFLPTNGQNACTDDYIATYAASQWKAQGLGYQPLTSAEQERARADCMQWADGQEMNGEAFRAVPKIMSGALTFNLGPSSGLWGGVGWSKQHPPMLINCCFLETSYRTSSKGYQAMGMGQMTTGVAVYPSWGSAFFASSMTLYNGVSFPNYYVGFHNFMTNGTLSLCANVSVYTGDRTFFDERTTTLSVRGAEYGSAQNNQAVFAVNVFDFDWRKRFGNLWWRLGQSNPDGAACNRVQLFDHSDKSYHWIRMRSGQGFDDDPSKDKPNPPDVYKNMIEDKGAFLLPSEAPGLSGWPGAPVKFPYVCGPRGALLEDAGREPEVPIPWLKGKVVNALTGQFITAAAQEVGNRICEALDRVWWNLQAISDAGTVVPYAFPPGVHLPACRAPPNFLAAAVAHAPPGFAPTGAFRLVPASSPRPLPPSAASPGGGRGGLTPAFLPWGRLPPGASPSR